jgi:hypothetical protein
MLIPTNYKISISQKRRALAHIGISHESHSHSAKSQYAHLAMSSCSEVGVYIQPALASYVN